MNLSKGLDNIFVLFTKFKLQKLPKVKLVTSSKYWVLFCVIAAITVVFPDPEGPRTYDMGASALFTAIFWAWLSFILVS